MKPSDYRKIQMWIEEIIDEWEIYIISQLLSRISVYANLTFKQKELRQLINIQLQDLKSLEREIAILQRMTERMVNTVMDFTVLQQDKLGKELAVQLGKEIKPNESMRQMKEHVIGNTNSYLQSLNLGFVPQDNKVRDLKNTYRYECAMYDAQTQNVSQDKKRQVLEQCARDIAQRGVVSYNADNNRCTTISAEYKRATVFGVEELTKASAEEMQKYFDTDYVEVTAHYGARPTHAVWQGKVYKVHGEEKGYPNLYTVTELGEVTGLKGVNCRHDYFPFVMGVSKRTYTDEELEAMLPENNKFTWQGEEYDGYTSTRKQRQMEARIKRQRRVIAGLQAIGSDESSRQEITVLKNLLAEYEAFSKEARLPMQIDKTTTKEYTPDINSRVWAVINKGLA